MDLVVLLKYQMFFVVYLFLAGFLLCKLTTNSPLLAAFFVVGWAYGNS